MGAISHRSEPDADEARLDSWALLPPRLQALLGVLPQLSRYSAASALALALDFTIYLLLTASAVRPSLAGVIGYAAGLALHYLLSVRFVFDARATRKVEARLVAEFALSGLAGMAVTALVIGAVADIAGLPVLLAKVLAATASFLVVFALRRTVVFAGRDATTAPLGLSAGS